MKPTRTPRFAVIGAGMSGILSAIKLKEAELVTAGIERIEPRGVRTEDGRLHELDVLVLATGFHVDRFVRPMTVKGEGEPYSTMSGRSGRRLPGRLPSRTSARRRRLRASETTSSLETVARPGRRDG